MNDDPRHARDPGAPETPPSPVRATPDSTPSEPKPANQLTPEEQMALFEKELKETDWGHQPC
jgi:hypothetical protein